MKKVKQSFTLIEILVVIVIIGILSSFIFFTINDSVEKANIAKSKMFAESIRNNLFLNLISEWTFEEDVSPYLTTKDTWGSNNGTVYGATYKTKDSGECILGACMSFDGNDYIDTGYKGIETISNALTIGTWLNSEVYTVYNDVWHDNHVVTFLSSSGNGLPDGSNMMHIGFYKNTFRARYCGNISESKTWSHNISSNEWHYIVYTLNFPKLKLYINGKKVNNEDNLQYLVSFTPNTKNIRIGRWSANDTYFKGKIDNTKIYNTALPESQIKQNYLAGLNNLYAKGLISEIEYREKIKELSLK